MQKQTTNNIQHSAYEIEIEIEDTRHKAHVKYKDKRQETDPPFQVEQSDS